LTISSVRNWENLIFNEKFPLSLQVELNQFPNNVAEGIACDIFDMPMTLLRRKSPARDLSKFSFVEYA
jgi:hypothetical protein